MVGNLDQALQLIPRSQTTDKGPVVIDCEIASESGLNSVYAVHFQTPNANGVIVDFVVDFTARNCEEALRAVALFSKAIAKMGVEEYQNILKKGSNFVIHLEKSASGLSGNVSFLPGKALDLRSKESEWIKRVVSCLGHHVHISPAARLVHRLKQELQRAREVQIKCEEIKSKKDEISAKITGKRFFQNRTEKKQLELLNAIAEKKASLDEKDLQLNEVLTPLDDPALQQEIEQMHGRQSVLLTEKVQLEKQMKTPIETGEKRRIEDRLKEIKKLREDLQMKWDQFMQDSSKIRAASKTYSLSEINLFLEKYQALVNETQAQITEFETLST